MAIDLNLTLIGGRLTRSPETKALPSGQNVTTFSVATNRIWTDKDGNKQEDVQFHNIVCFARTAENVAKYLDKGDSVLVQGRSTTRSWENEGVKHYRTEIVAESVQFGEKGKSVDRAKTYDATDYPEGPDPDSVPF